MVVLVAVLLEQVMQVLVVLETRHQLLHRRGTQGVMAQRQVRIQQEAVAVQAQRVQVEQ
jgi:hypothetical protein